MQQKFNNLTNYLRTLLIKIGGTFNHEVLEKLNPLADLLSPQLNIKELKKYDLLTILSSLENAREEVESFASLPALISIKNGHTIQIFSHTFYDQEGKVFQNGQVENYLADLCELILELGYQPFIVQHSKSFWHNNYKGIEVFGIPTHSKSELLNIIGHDKIFGQPHLRIFANFILAYPYTEKFSIGISHNMLWDESDRSKEILPIIFEAYKSLYAVVSTEKSILFWLNILLPTKTTDDLKQTIYLPNYVNIAELPLKKKLKTDKLIVLYPGTLSKAGGFYIIHSVAVTLIEKYDNLEFHFLGKIEGEYYSKIKNLLKLYPERILHYDKNFLDAVEVFNNADITIIPISTHEATSLICLQAMASKNAIIGSSMAGLMDLIIHNFNGLLVDPKLISLFNGVDQLIKAPELRNTLGDNAYEVAKIYNKTQWNNNWKNLMLDILYEKNNTISKIYVE